MTQAVEAAGAVGGVGGVVYGVVVGVGAVEGGVEVDSEGGGGRRGCHGWLDVHDAIVP